MRRLLRADPPDLLILIDFAEFNMALAGVAHGCGVPVLYYISPQVWAWRRGRIRKIARRVDRLAVVFPFEASLYAGTAARAEFVGHPLLDRVAPSRPRAETLAPPRPRSREAPGRAAARQPPQGDAASSCPPWRRRRSVWLHAGIRSACSRWPTR